MSNPIRQLHRKLQGLTRPRKDAPWHEAAGLTRIEDTAPEDVFIVGYPKSGLTWMQNLGAGLLYGLTAESAPDALIQEVVPDLEFKRYYKRYRTPTLFKTHQLPKPQFRRVIYVLRDGRDVLVSYLQFLGKIHGRSIDAAEAVRTGAGVIDVRWEDHVEHWLANPHQAEMLVVKYEDLQRDTTAELVKICRFIGLARDGAVLDRVGRGASFAAMRQREEQTGWANPAWPKDAYFMRRGQVGSHKDELPREVCAAFEQRAGATLRKHGYA